MCMYKSKNYLSKSNKNYQIFSYNTCHLEYDNKKVNSVVNRTISCNIMYSTSSLYAVTIKFNSLVDALVRDIVQWLNIDAIDLPNIDDVLEPSSTDYFYLFNGRGSNLKDVTRGGDSKLVFHNKTTALYTGLCVNKFNFCYDYDANIKGYTICGKITGTIHKLTVKCKMKITKELEIEFEHIDFSIEDVTVNIAGDGVKGWFLSSIFSWYLKPLIKPKVTKYANQKLRDELSKLTKAVNEKAAQYRNRIKAVDFFRLWLTGV